MWLYEQQKSHLIFPITIYTNKGSISSARISLVNNIALMLFLTQSIMPPPFLVWSSLKGFVKLSFTNWELGKVSSSFHWLVVIRISILFPIIYQLHFWYSNDQIKKFMFKLSIKRFLPFSFLRFCKYSMNLLISLSSALSFLQLSTLRLGRRFI